MSQDQGSGIRDQGSVDVLGLAQQLIDIESTTGNEGAVGAFLADYLRGRGYSVLEQPLGVVRLKADTTEDQENISQVSPEDQRSTSRVSPVESGFSRTTRRNVIAAVGEPEVVFSTHFDCVPPFFPSRIEDGKLYGRGACDAKGILAAQ
ncbi:MAG: M20/M25/M40 family metallo-hydrolase, partial [Acidobacteriota bacterium]